MNLRIAGLLVLNGFAATANAQLLAIVDATVVDVATGSVAPRTTVLIDGATIRRVGADIDVPPGAQVVDASGGYLIPGLWDMHVHLSYARSNALLTLVANGVTSVRDIGSNLAEVDVWRGRIVAGELVGPSIVRAGPILNHQEFNRYQLAITDAGDARATVRALAKAGVDFIKVHRRTSREPYFAALDEAKALGLPLGGHIRMTVAPIEASRSGQVTIEHAETLFEGTFAATLGSRDRVEAIRKWLDGPESLALFAASCRTTRRRPHAHRTAKSCALAMHRGQSASRPLRGFVLLDANPFDDIRNTQRIRAVFLRGRHFDCDALDALLEESAALARVN